ncbi:MAG: hypothetical protein ACLQVX_00190 [Limisphaerales bacterium]
MKRKSQPLSRLISAAAGLSLAASALLGRAQTFENPQAFDSGIGSWITWNGWGIQGFLTWDPTRDAANDPDSGSLRYDVPFTGDSADQFMTFGTLHNQWGWDNTTEVNIIGVYTNIVFDFELDPATAPAKDGTFGTLTIGLVTDGWANYQEGSYTIPASATNWTHVTIPIAPTSPNADKTVGFYLNMWSGGNFTNTLSFNVDNIGFEALPTNAPPLPPPTMTLEKAGPSGVEIIMDGAGDQWNRNALSTPAGGGPYLWTSQGTYPVTYACTITNFPDIATHLGFEAHMYLVNGDTAPSGQDVSGSPDWTVPDLLIFRVENAATNVMAQIQWKTNYPNANATNVPVVVYAPSAVGTWTLTFTDSTDGILTGPGITATNFSLPADAVQNNFSPATSFLQFGMFKNDGANDGHNNAAHGTYSRVQFSGAPANSFDDSFTGPTLTNKYAWQVTSSTAVQYVPPGTAWLVDWTLPAIQFNPQSAPAITGPWSPAVFTSTYSDSIRMHGLVSQASMAGASAGFFRLIKRPFVQLQVLMPGETSAPNTPTGKTGTPTPQSVGMPFNITVNAVDSVWNVIPSSDTIDITSSDTTFSPPPDNALSAGTMVFSVSFNTAGTFTVTATDVTDPTKTAGTSSPTVAQ